MAMAKHHNLYPADQNVAASSSFKLQWTSTVSGTTSVTMPATGSVTISSGAYGMTNPNASGTPNIFVTTTELPKDGMIAVINGKVCRYNEPANMWQEIGTTSPTETVEVPTLPIELDTSGMLAALRQYRDFLDDLDGLDQRYADAVSDTLFGLNEAIEALETIE